MTTETSNKILKRLKRQQQEEGKLPLLLGFYRHLVTVQLRTAENITSSKSTLSEPEIVARLTAGEPLLTASRLEEDLTAVRTAFIDTVAVFAKYPQLFGDIPDRFKNSEAGRLLTKKALRDWYSGNNLPANLINATTGNVMLAVIQAAAKPFLSRYASEFKGSIKQESWRRGYCPVCGGNPDIAYLEKEVGAKWLLCSRCDFEWAFPRLECPFCRNNEPGKLNFFSDEVGYYRLHVCDSCRCYLKVIDLRQTGDEVLLPLERLLTLDLDTQAKQLGYITCQNTVKVGY